MPLRAWAVGVAAGALIGFPGWAAAQPAAPRPITLTVWMHQGQPAEDAAVMRSIRAFEARHPELRIALQRLPEGSYSDQVNAAAVARKLPCLLDFDGPNVTNYAWTGRLLPLDGFPELDAARADLLPSIARQGQFGGRLYSMGVYDSGLGLWARRSLLERVGARIPNGVDDAWTLAEFEDVLARLKAAGVATPLDMKFNYGVGEWFTYGFSPLLQSFGGDLIDRRDFQRSEGVINGPGAVAAMRMLQRWIAQGWVNPRSKDDAEFIRGRAALSYVGHWMGRAHAEALGTDLLLLPVPRFGGRAVTGAGSWNFGIAANCRHPQWAARLLAHLMSPDEVLAITAANGAPPGTRTALQRSPDYRPGGPLQVFGQQLERGIAVVRPPTPAYPVITAAFAEALNNIIAGRDPKPELDRAARRIDEEIADNRGFSIRGRATPEAAR